MEFCIIIRLCINKLTLAYEDDGLIMDYGAFVLFWERMFVMADTDGWNGWMD